MGDSGLVRVQVPLLEPSTRAPAHESRFGPLPSHFPGASPPLRLSSGEAATSGNGSGRFGQDEAAPEVEHAAAVLALARQATPISEIVRQVYGTKSGQAFQRASLKVMAIISQALPAEEDD